MSVVAPSSAAASGAPSRADRRLPGLDGLRGLAVAWVLAFHLWPDVVRGGWLGVGLFFTLSGYLIAGLLETEVTTTGRLRLGRFMARRARRLLPAALVTISGALALTAVLDDQPLREIGVDALTAALNVFNWHASLDEVGYAGIFEAAPEPLAHFWSLAIEEQFYLVFPAAVALTRRPGRVVCAMAAIGLVGVWLWWGSTDAYVATPVRALEIAAGAGLAVAQARYGAVRRLFQPHADSRRLHRTAWAVLLAGAAALTVLSVARLGPDEALVFRGGPQLMALCWIVLLIAAVRDGWPARLMSWAPLRWLGLRSYAIYLIHWPVIELTGWHPVVVIAVTLGAAEASFRLLEMPVRRGTGRRATPLLAAAAAVVVAASAVAAATSSPARGIGERAEGADELPAWLTEQNAPETAAPATAVAPSSLPEPAAPDPAPATTPAVPSTTAEPPAEPPAEPDETSGSEPPSSLASEPPPPTESAVPSETPPPPTDPPSESTQDAPEGTGDTTPPPTVPPTTVPPTTVPPPPETGLAVPIITVIGDSTAVHIADGLREWADNTRAMAVVDHSRIGCSPAAVGGSTWHALRGQVGDEPTPSGFQAGVYCRDDHIQPGSAVVLVVDHGAVLFDHLRDDGTWASILDPDLASDVADSYRQLVADARARGVRVVFTTAPQLLTFGDGPSRNQPQTSPERAEAYNALITDLVLDLNGPGEAPMVELIETATALDESGYNGLYGRSDGMHVDYEKAGVFAADVLGPALLAMLGLG